MKLDPDVIAKQSREMIINYQRDTGDLPVYLPLTMDEYVALCRNFDFSLHGNKYKVMAIETYMGVPIRIINWEKV